MNAIKHFKPSVMAVYQDFSKSKHEDDLGFVFKEAHDGLEIVAINEGNKDFAMRAIRAMRTFALQNIWEFDRDKKQIHGKNVYLLIISSSGDAGPRGYFLDDSNIKVSNLIFDGYLQSFPEEYISFYSEETRNLFFNYINSNCCDRCMAAFKKNK